MKTLLTIAILFCCTTLFAQAGAIDSSFGNGGKFTLTNNGYPSYIYTINAMAIQADGKIVMAGNGYNYVTSNSYDFAVIRLNRDGSLDNSFGDNGEVFIDFSDSIFGSTYDVAYGIAIQADGKIVVAGNANGYNYIPETNTNNYSDFAVARINADGSPDNTFNGNGKKLIDLSDSTSFVGFNNNSYDYCKGVAVKTNGKIVLAGGAYITDSAGYNNYDAAAVQLNTDGSLDQSFHKSGIQVLKRPGADETINGIALQQDGKIVLCGTAYTYSTNSRLMMAIRLKNGGSPDNSFDGDGFATTDAGTVYAEGTSVAIQTNGKILVGGNAYNANRNVALIRFNTNGTLDNSFNGNGASLYFSDNDYSYGAATCIQKSGKIIQTGYQYSYSQAQINYNGYQNFLVLRYGTNGRLDSSFGNSGRSIVDFGNWTDQFPDNSTACAIQANGKIIAAGITGNGPCAARLQTIGKNTSLSGPGDQSAALADGQCTATFNNIDPILIPDTSYAAVKYSLYATDPYPSYIPYDSGYGTVSGKPFNIGNTTVVYSLVKDQLQRAVFNVNVTGGTPAGALDFDGVDDRVDMQLYDPILNDVYGQYSFEAWIKVRGYNKQEGAVIFGNEHNNNGGILVELNPKGFISTYQPSVGMVVSSYKVPLNKWTHIAFVQTSSNLSLYVNGNFVQTLLSAPNLHAGAYANFYLGAYGSDDTTFSRHFNGEMDEVRVWSRAICQAQIRNNLNCEIADYAEGLSTYYTFNQGLASCNNPSITNVNGRPGYATLQNFALNGPTSNWVAGHISGSCAAFTPLAINCPNPVSVQAAEGACSAVAGFAVTAMSGCSDSISITYSQNPGTYFPVGTTYVNASVQDGFGNTANCQFPVTVTETIPPYLTTKDTSVSLDYYGNAYINPYAVVDSLSDNCGLDYYNSLNVYPTYFNCANAGSNTVTVTATDLSGNTTTKTATVTVLPYAGYSSVQVVPNPQQYSDVASLQATLYGAQGFYYNGCAPATDVTFKVGNKVIGTVLLSPDFYGNLVGISDYPVKGLGNKKVTALFGGVNTSAYTFINPDTATLYTTPENAVVDYIGAQIIESATNKVTIPVAASLTDTADGYRGDIRNAVATFTIQPVTGGASIIGPNTITVPALEFVSSDHTSGVARTDFNVSTGGKQKAEFMVSLQVGNAYTGSIGVPIIVTKQASAIASGSALAATGSKMNQTSTDFYVTVSPNPSHDHYNIRVYSSKFEKISIRIADITGKTIETFSNINPNQVVQLGSRYAAGTYIAEITQGENKKVFKLIKL